MTKKVDASRWFTVGDGATPTAIAAVYRGALAAQRPRIEDFSVDVLSDGPWPSEVLWAVAELEARLQERRTPSALELLGAHRNVRVRPWFLRWLPRDRGPTVDLMLADDHDFDLAMAIAPFTIGGTGISDSQTIIWDGNDTGTSGAFQLTEDEVDEVRRFLALAGVNESALVPLPRRGDRGS